MLRPRNIYIIYIYALLGTMISATKALLKMIFLFPRWDMLVPWRVYMIYIYVYLDLDHISIEKFIFWEGPITLKGHTPFPLLPMH